MGNIHCLNRKQQNIDRMAELFKEHIVVSRGIQCETGNNCENAELNKSVNGAFNKNNVKHIWRPRPYRDHNREDDIVDSISTLSMSQYGKWNTNNNLVSREFQGELPFHQNNSNLQTRNYSTDNNKTSRRTQGVKASSRPNQKYDKENLVQTFQNKFLPRGLKTINTFEDRTASYTSNSNKLVQQGDKRHSIKDSTFDDMNERNIYYSDEEYRLSEMDSNGCDQSKYVYSNFPREYKDSFNEKYQSSSRTRTMDNTSKDADYDPLSFSSDSTVHNNKNSDENNPSAEKSVKTTSTLKEFSNFIKRKRKKKKSHKKVNENATNCSDDFINIDNTHTEKEQTERINEAEDSDTDEPCTPLKYHNVRPVKSITTDKYEPPALKGHEGNDNLLTNLHSLSSNGSTNRLSILPPHQGPNGKIPILVARPMLNRRPYFSQVNPRNRSGSMIPQNELYSMRRRSLSSNAVLNSSVDRVCQSPSSRAGTPNAVRGYRTPTLLWRNSMTPIRGGGSGRKSESPRNMRNASNYYSNSSLNRSIPAQKERIGLPFSHNDPNLATSNSKLANLIPVDNGGYIQSFNIPENFANHFVDACDKRVPITLERFNCKVLDIIPSSSRRQTLSLVITAPNKEILRRCLLSIDRTMKWSLTQQLK